MTAEATTRSSRTLRERLAARERLAGTFVKTTHHQVVEVLARTGLDFVVLDAEHAPFDRAALDASLLAARALGLPALVRVADAARGGILTALDMGAEGVLVPHVSDAAVAARAAAAARYRGGGRGFSSSHRAGGYGRSDLLGYIREADERTLVIAQIEDLAALDRLEALMAAPGIDGWFIGRADLMVSAGAASLDAPAVAGAVERIAAAARAAARPFGLFLPAAEPRELARFTAMGASFFVIGSDQSLMQAAARGLVHRFHAGGADHER